MFQKYFKNSRLSTRMGSCQSFYSRLALTSKSLSAHLMEILTNVTIVNFKTQSNFFF